MIIAGLIEQMAAAGAPLDAIVIAVRAIEEGSAVETERRARATERKRRERERERDRMRDGHATVTGQSRDTPRPPSFPHTPKHPPISPRTTPDEVRDDVSEPGSEPVSASIPTSGPTLGSISEPNGETLGRGLADAAGRALAELASAPGLIVLSEPMNWIANGCDFQADILPTIRARCSRARPSSIRSWSYFTEAVYQARDNRLKPEPEATLAQQSRSFRTSRPAATSPQDAILAAFARRAGAHLATTGGGEPDPDTEPGAYGGRTIDLVAVGG
ncbi:hypothetical protein ANOBCDAF_01470 [Pleomorphomonas sp. T1.2MG-36]|uniref:hypothetical protein n=1 Tax=Pleomorphomonas sp. T1.2MG-36 TaxID=3041167 RepID=UPI0024778305|nr:hypothetical protein [Pleomorphomonas sp. T1.2MG-36]CAI9406572.1 hypothetical protein ANOBCDAF_01470 [Pleomorphomonas sp. T1.2MG-36]